MKQSNLIAIQEFAEMCRTTVRTIRFYDKLGLLKPTRVDEFTKYRYYSPFQTRDFFRIRLLQNFKVPLRDIQEATSQPFLEKKIREVEEELLEKRKEYRFLKSVNKFFFTKIDLKKVLKKESFGPYILLALKVEKGRYDRLNSDIKFVHDTAEKLKIPKQFREIVFYLDPDKYKPKDTRFEISILTRLKRVPKMKLPENFFFKSFPRTLAYVYTYRGPYEFITLVYEKLHENNVLELPDVSPYPFDFQVYGPLNKKSPYDHLTKISFPVKT